MTKKLLPHGLQTCINCKNFFKDNPSTASPWSITYLKNEIVSLRYDNNYLNTNFLNC